jgi:hypothetical protein
MVRERRADVNKKTENLALVHPFDNEPGQAFINIEIDQERVKESFGQRARTSVHQYWG